ncbi:hypothetical protein CVT25_008942 [Psilocybe cyanescens]|uniref:Uncharacterized protein n=1 Tax=Psilocybe cyanescens TaxID=93625 RepID=A0A409XNE8_PSICY|nr:hypothetical protein CVT25_008942 [Psilocybe cyanescens]
MYQGQSQDLAKVLAAMLEFAEECEGTQGKPYVASIIITCNKRPREAIKDMSTVVKSQFSYAKQPNATLTSIMTLTYNKTVSVLLEPVGIKKSSFRANIYEIFSNKIDFVACSLELMTVVNTPSVMSLNKKKEKWKQN